MRPAASSACQTLDFGLVPRGTTRAEDVEAALKYFFTYIYLTYIDILYLACIQHVGNARMYSNRDRVFDNFSI